MTTGPLNESSTLLSLEAVAEHLDVPESTVREWLATFNWERRYDGAGHLYLTQRDIEFLGVIKSLKEVDRSCESIVRIISTESLSLDVVPAEFPAESPEVEDPSPVVVGLEQIATLKAELKELHARPARRSFWQFWKR